MVLVFAIVKAPEYGWGWVSARSGCSRSASCFWSRSPSSSDGHRLRLVRLGIFRIRSLASANGVLLLVAGGLFAMFFFASLYVQQILGYSPLEAGLAFLPVTAGIVLGSGLSAQLIRRVGVKAVLVTGLVVAAAGLGLLTLIAPDGTYLESLLPGLVVMSVGLGLALVLLTLVANTNVEEEDARSRVRAFQHVAADRRSARARDTLDPCGRTRQVHRYPESRTRPPRSTASALVDGYSRAFAWAPSSSRSARSSSSSSSAGGTSRRSTRRSR